MGLYAMNRRILELFEAGQFFGLDHLMLALLENKRTVARFLHTGQWLDIGRLEDYEAAQENPTWGVKASEQS
jgi:mannose-1-phosphate guanylyltransferase